MLPEDDIYYVNKKAKIYNLIEIGANYAFNFNLYSNLVWRDIIDRYNVDISSLYNKCSFSVTELIQMHDYSIASIGRIAKAKKLEMYQKKENYLKNIKPVSIHRIFGKMYKYYEVGARSFHSPLLQREDYGLCNILTTITLHDFCGLSLDTLDDTERGNLKYFALIDCINTYVQDGGSYTIPVTKKYSKYALKLILRNMYNWAENEMNCRKHR